MQPSGEPPRDDVCHHRENDHEDRDQGGVVESGTRVGVGLAEVVTEKEERQTLGKGGDQIEGNEPARSHPCRPGPDQDQGSDALGHFPQEKRLAAVSFEVLLDPGKAHWGDAEVSAPLPIDHVPAPATSRVPHEIAGKIACDDDKVDQEGIHVAEIRKIARDNGDQRTFEDG